jgi:hypothetical protein
MNCEELKSKMLNCSKEDKESRECKEIVDKFQFECKKEEKSWFWSKEEEGKKEEIEGKKDDEDEKKEDEKKEDEKKEDEKKE